MILNNEITVFNPQSGLKVAKGAMDKTGVGRIIPIKIERPNSQPQPGDTGDGNASSSGGGRFSGHKPQFQSGQGDLKKWSGQDYEKIKRKCKSRGVLFEDPEFPAANHLLVDDNKQVKFSSFLHNFCNFCSLKFYSYLLTLKREYTSYSIFTAYLAIAKNSIL